MNMGRWSACCVAAITLSVMSLASARHAIAETVYQNDFETKKVDGWSKDKLSETPKGECTFLGNFGAERVTLTLKDLPKHKFIRVSFDLYVIRTWDGETTQESFGEAVGPDVFTFQIDDRPAAVRCTFSNLPKRESVDRQSYPFSSPGVGVPAQWGAKEKGTLGYMSSFDGGEQPCDSVYAFSLVLPHTADVLKLRFAGVNLQELSDESWGLDNVKVEALAARKVVKLSARELDQHWNDLAGADITKAYGALQKLVSGGDETVAFLRTKVAVTKTKDPNVDALIAALDADSFARREQASQQLKALGEQVRTRMEALAREAKSPEVQWRARNILKELGKPAQPDPTNPGDLRRRRAMQVLMMMGVDASSVAMNGAAK